MKKKIEFATVFAMLLVVISSLIMANKIQSIYPNKYKFWSVGSSIVATGEWHLIFTKSNYSSNPLPFTYTSTETTKWQWHTPIPIGLIFLGQKANGTSQGVNTFKIEIPPFKTFGVYRRYITKDYYYKYQKGEIVQLDDNSAIFKPYGPPIDFYETIVSSGYQTTLSTITSSLESHPLVYEDLSEWGFHGKASEFYVNTDPYGNMVVLKESSPLNLYVINPKNEIKDVHIPMKEAFDIVNGVDIFKNTLIIATFKNLVASTTSNVVNISVKGQLFLYNYKNKTIKKVLDLKDAFISSPVFSNDGKEVTYSEYKNGKTAIYIVNLENGKIKLLYKNVEWPTLAMSNSAWNKNRSICFGNSKKEFIIAVKNGDDYAFSKIEPSSRIGWYYISSPFFISNDVAGFVDGSTSTLIVFNTLTKKVIDTVKLDVDQNNLLGVQCANGRILVVRLRK
ncbi:TolB family protein [Mesoaciditoga lauensis]|uniref:TolB family protein n=1 Tax=Mesoaciditoga lauensis TaxID=1495039 RepID=UPI0012E0AA29|nr:hypothetical protein [Mesoaciditoga lauensis]